MALLHGVSQVVLELSEGRIETFSIRFFMRNRKSQFAVMHLKFHVAEISDFSKASSSVQFSSFLFSQNIIQHKNTYRNCKLAREARRHQKAYDCLLYTSPSPRDLSTSRMPSSA